MYEDLTKKKRELDELPPLKDDVKNALGKQMILDFVCAGNCFDGSSLTRRETEEILYRDMTVPKHSLTEHIRTLNLKHGFEMISEKALRHSANPVDDKDVKEFHRIVVRGLDDKNAGMYRGFSINFGDTDIVLPDSVKVLRLMDDFGMWLFTARSLHPVTLAAEAHLRLLSIQPFADGNAAVARLLMNFLLLRAGYPPAVFARREKREYWTAVRAAAFDNMRGEYDKIIGRAVNRGLDLYKKAAVSERIDDTDNEPYFMRIGQLAKETGERVSTLRYWTQMGLLETAGKTSADYVLYSSDVFPQIQRLKKLKDERYTLEEIKKIVRAE